jgi:hypothetical protein
MSVTASAPSVETAESLHAYVEAEIISVSGPLNANLDPGLTLMTNTFLLSLTLSY